MFRKIRSYLGGIRFDLRFYRESYLDARRYLTAARVASSASTHPSEYLESDIIRRYHVIEKGLAMPNFRPRFGAQVVRQLASHLHQWRSLCGDAPSSLNNQIITAHSVLDAYVSRHKELNIDISDILGDYSPDSIGCASEHQGGVIPVPRIETEAATAFESVVRARTSVRDFQTDRVPAPSLIEEAVSLAISSPSVCNRQTWRVHAFEGERAQEILELQNGNRGFGHTIPTVLITTCDMRYFEGQIERYQAWIDGGMFSMTLLLALHAKGLGTVALNWSVVNARDEALRKVAKIPPYERIVMLIGCGYTSEEAVVARSLRRPTSDFIHWDKAGSSAV